VESFTNEKGIPYMKKIRIVAGIMVIFFAVVFTLPGCGRGGCDRGAQSGGTPASGDTSGVGPIGPIGPVIQGATGGPDLIWAVANMGDAQNREVLEPTAGEPVNIYGVIYNQGDTLASNINATIKINDNQVSGTDSLVCDAGLYNRLSALNYVFNAAGDYKLTLDITGCNPPEAGAATDPSGNHMEKTIHVLAAGQAPPQPPVAPAVGPDLLWTQDEILDTQGNHVNEPIVGVPVNFSDLIVNNSGIAVDSINVTVSMDGGVINPFPNLTCEPHGPLRIRTLNYVFNAPGDHTLSLDILSCNPPEVGEAASPASNHKEIPIHVLAAGQAPQAPAGDIIAVKLRFIEYPEAILTDHTTVGHKGSLGFWAKNTFVNPVDIYLNMTDGPITIYDGPLNNLRPGEYVYQFDYKFTTAGQHNVVANIRLVNSQVAEDPNTNTANCPVLVGDHLPPTATPVGSNLPTVEVVPTGGGVGVMETNPTHPWTAERRGPKCDLEVSQPTFWGTGYNVGNEAEVGDTGNIKFNISNKSGKAAPGVTAKLVVTIKETGRKWIDTSWPVDLPVGASIPENIRISPLPQAGTYRMDVEIDTDPHKTDDTKRSNNTSYHGFTVFERGHFGTGTVQSRQTAAEGDSGRGEKMLKREPDARAGDIGFIPNSARDYVDEVYQGEKGSLYGVFYNDSDVDIKNLKVQILVDGRVIRNSVKMLMKAGESASFKFSNYWFNTLGSHKVSLIVDPDNQIKELDEKNNRIGHTVNVIPRPRPRATTYDNSGAAALSGFLGTLGKGKGTGGGGPAPSVYTPPATPRVTTTVVDQGGSSGTTTKKTAPTFTTKGLGK